MSLADSEIVGIVRGRDLHRSGAEVCADPTVGDHGNFAPHQRQQQLLAVQMLVAVVVRIHGHGYVAEHGFRARGGDGEELARLRFSVLAEDRVANLP